MAPFLLDHVAFGVPDVAPAAALLAGELGGRALSTGPGGGFVFWQWEFAGGGRIEIIAPDGPPGGFLHRFLAARGAGPHHVTFKVSDIRRELDRAREQGYEPVGFDDSDPGWIEAFLHPKQAQGIVVQLAESSYVEDPVVQTPSGFPPAPATAEPARVLGLHLAARSEERARRQWETLLGGTLERAGRDLLFRWPESPLRLSVSVQPDVAEGPQALLIATTPRLALPEGPHPSLGLPLLAVEDPTP